MTVGYGQIGHFQFNIQDSFGTMFVDSLEAMPIVDESISETIEQLVEDGMYARHMAGPTHVGPMASAGGISFEPQRDTIGWMLKSATGQSSSGIDASSAVVHTFRPLHNSDWLEHSALPPNTLVVHRDVGSATAYADMNLTTLTFEMAHSELLKASADFTGGVEQGVIGVAPTYSNAPPWVWDQGSMSIGGVGITEFRTFTWTQTNNIEPAYTITDSKTPSHMRREGMVEVSATGTLLADTAVHSHLHSIFIAQTETQLLINFDGLITNSPGALLFDMPKARITEYTWNIAGPGQIEMNISLMGKWDEGSSYLCQYTLTNSRLGYGVDAATT